MAKPDYTALGLMSGTSMDGVDVAVVTTDGHRRVKPGAWMTVPYRDDLRGRLARLVAAPDTADPHTLIEMSAAITDAHAEAVQGFLSRHFLDARKIDVVGFHGHTISHRPDLGITRQIGDGARLAAALGIDVVDDFRSADVAAGGQGAPLAPLYHAALAVSLPQPLAVLNIGGVANVTLIDGETLLAFDTGPGNGLVDDWVARHTGLPYDAEGRLAASGQVAEAALERLLDDPYFALAPPKSLDRHSFSPAAADGLSPADGAATLTVFTAETIVRALDHLPVRPRRWLVTGGGRHNRFLMALLRARLGVPVEAVEAVGWQGDALEAQAFGYLAVRSLRGLPLSLPGTTGTPLPTRGGVLHKKPNRPAPAAARQVQG
ncbi:MAG: anhydro-N-acetylmuramic acid kinase [Rhodospirillaceae bacterium]|nr:anhydro-N-acetylmuramic acid kinase [Rhodospirillaceae bacterium]